MRRLFRILRRVGIGTLLLLNLLMLFFNFSLASDLKHEQAQHRQIILDFDTRLLQLKASR